MRAADLLTRASDAIEIDNSDLSEEEQFDMAMAVVIQVIGKQSV